MYNHIFRTTILIVVSLIATLCPAQENNYKWEANFSGGLNTEGWEFSGGVHWMPFQYFGIGTALGFNSEIKEISDWGRDENDWSYCTRFVFKPSLLFRTPRLLSVNSNKVNFHIFASPGIIMSPYARGAKNSNWIYWNGSAGVTTAIYRCTFSLGYSCSNFSLYDGNPPSHHDYDKETDKKNYTHSIFISFGYKF